MTLMTISGADVFTPRAAADELRKVASVYADLPALIDQSIANLTEKGVTGEAVDMLRTMLDAATIVASAAEQAAAKCDEHVQFVADTFGSDPALAGTQAGGYLDASAL